MASSLSKVWPRSMYFVSTNPQMLLAAADALDLAASLLFRTQMFEVQPRGRSTQRYHAIGWHYGRVCEGIMSKTLH